MSGDILGNTLVIDNVYDDVKDLISNLRESGKGVLFLENPPRENECPSNIRLVIIDLDLDGCGDVTDEDLGKLVLTLQRVESRTKFYLVAPWSNYIVQDEQEYWADRIKEKYQEQTGRKFPAFFLRPFGKSIGQKKLIDEIRRWIEENPHAGIVFEWEKLIEDARDGMVSDVVSTGEIQTLVKSIEQEGGRESISREIVSLFNKILLRHVTRNDVESLKTCAISVLEQSSGTGDALEWYSNLHYLNAYYRISENEDPWTGDIYKTHYGNPENKYAMLITPACDFAQKKVNRFKVVYGLRFKEIPTYNREEEPIPQVVKRIGKDNKGYYRNRNEILKMLIKGKDLPAKYYILQFLKERDNESYFHLLLDFQTIGSFEIIPPSWNRICRVDSPWIDDILQKYSSLSARIGTPVVPEDVITAELEKYRDE